MAMMELQLTLDFECCICGQPVSVTVKCEGDGLWKKNHFLATVNVPCPHCNHANLLSFEPSGRVREVKRYSALHLLAEPSLN